MLWAFFSFTIQVPCIFITLYDFVAEYNLLSANLLFLTFYSSVCPNPHLITFPLHLSLPLVACSAHFHYIILPTQTNYIIHFRFLPDLIVAYLMQPSWFKVKMQKINTAEDVIYFFIWLIKEITEKIDWMIERLTCWVSLTHMMIILKSKELTRPSMSFISFIWPIKKMTAWLSG